METVKGGQRGFRVCLDGLFDSSSLVRELLANEINADFGPDCCACCDDARERLRCRRPVLDACFCHLAPEVERCECSFCRAVVGLREKK